MFDKLEVERLQDRIAILPAYNGSDTATTQHHDYDNTDDETRIALLGRSRGIGHFIHDFFSL